MLRSCILAGVRRLRRQLELYKSAAGFKHPVGNPDGDPKPRAGTSDVGRAAARRDLRSPGYTELYAYAAGHADRDTSGRRVLERVAVTFAIADGKFELYER